MSDSEIPPPDAPDLMPRGKEDSFLREMRMRYVELLLSRCIPAATIVSACASKWRLSEETIYSYVSKVRARWREEWKQDPDRLEDRTRAIMSLRQAIAATHEIIHAKRKVRTPLKNGAFAVSTEYTYSTKERLSAMSRLAILERTLAPISGYAGLPPEAPPPPPPRAEESDIGAITIEMVKDIPSNTAAQMLSFKAIRQEMDGQ